MSVSKEFFVTALVISIFFLILTGSLYLLGFFSIEPVFVRALPLIEKAFITISSWVIILLFLLAFQYIHNQAHMRAKKEKNTVDQ